MGLALTIVVVVGLWLVAWGSFWAALAGNLAMSRGARAGMGLTWGFLLGPVGMAVVAARTRGGGRGVRGRVTEARAVAERSMSAASTYGDRARQRYDARRR